LLKHEYFYVLSVPNASVQSGNISISYQTIRSCITTTFQWLTGRLISDLAGLLLLLTDFDENTGKFN
jgi:hypothetical protein